MLDSTTLPTPEEIEAINAEKDATLVAQANRIEQLEADLRAQAAAPKSNRGVPALPTETFKVDKKEYRVRHGVFTKKNEELVKVSPAEILRDKELREHLVKIKSTAVEEV